MVIREYRKSDCKETADLFYNTIHNIAAKDYTPEQLNAWASGKLDLEEWNQTLLEHYSVVALDGNAIVGFGDIDKTGYLDRLYVHTDYQGKGIATLICDELEKRACGGTIITYASITARSFFEKRGYKLLRENQAERHGILLTNYLMEKKRD